MQNLRFDRIHAEINWRLLGSLGNKNAEHELKRRCINAIESKTIQNLFEPITVHETNPRTQVIRTAFISENKIASSLNSTGVMDLIYICINAQKQHDI